MSSPGTDNTKLGYIPIEVKYSLEEAQLQFSNKTSIYNGRKHIATYEQMDVRGNEIAYCSRNRKWSDYIRYRTSLNGWEVPGNVTLEEWKKMLIEEPYNLEPEQASKLCQLMTMQHNDLVGITRSKVSYEAYLSNQQNIENVSGAGLTQVIGYGTYQAYCGDSIMAYAPTSEEVEKTDWSKLAPQGEVWGKITLRAKPSNHYDRVTEELLLIRQQLEDPALFSKMFDVKLGGEAIHYIQYINYLNKFLYS